MDMMKASKMANANRQQLSMAKASRQHQQLSKPTINSSSAAAVSSVSFKRKFDNELFKKSSKKFMSYTTYFLTNNVIIKLPKPIEVTKIQNERLVVNICNQQNLQKLKKDLKFFQNTFLQETIGGGDECDEVLSFINNDDTFYINFKNNVSKIFDCNKKEIEELPNKSLCRMSIIIIGIKVSDEKKGSFMYRVHQIMALPKPPPPITCIFSSEDDTDDTDVADEEEEERGQQLCIDLDADDDY
jgi:hypothetical protein